MSEKRFVVKELNFEDTVIEDTVRKEQYNEYGVVDLLNTLAEENEQLKKELLRIKKTVSSIQKQINNYYNEVCSNE